MKDESPPNKSIAPDASIPCFSTNFLRRSSNAFRSAQVNSSVRRFLADLEVKVLWESDFEFSLY
jgi:hypothetical protein